MDINKLKELILFTKTLKVLYVEDDKEARKQTLEMLNNFCDKIDIAVDGQDGLQMYQAYYEQTNRYYDLVISDIMMPNMDGIMMSKLMKNTNPNQHIVIISAYNDAKNLEELIEIGVTNYLHKPVKFNYVVDVFEKVAQLISSKNVLDENFKKIEQLNHELDAMVDSFDVYVIASRTDLKGKITYASKAYQEISGYSEAELLGKPHSIVRHPDMPSSAFKDMWNTIESGKLWIGEVKNLRKDGTHYWVKAFIAPYYDKSGAHIGYSAIREDITAKKEVEALHNRVNDLLNNAGQGFLSFNSKLQIEAGYSLECLNIFNKTDIESLNIAELLFFNSSKQLFCDGISRILDSSDDLSRDLFLSLLPKEQEVFEKSIKIEYNFLDNSRFMLILTDITQTKKLESRVAAQQQIQKMIVAVVTNKNEFLELKFDFESFVASPPNEIKTLLRELHTFKGIFAQKEMVNIVIGIHNLETSINEALDKGATIDEVLELCSSAGLFKVFQKDLKIITDTLGEDFLLTSCSLTVDTNALDKIELKLQSILNHSGSKDNAELSDILSDLQHLKDESIFEMLSAYPTAVKQAAQNADKYIYPLEIVGDKNSVVSPKIRPFMKSLIHLFNNCVDHGIEDIDTRAEMGKDEMGTITCKFEEDGNTLELQITDDGAGIEIKKLALSAIKKGFKTAPEINKMSKDELLNLVFADSVSTKDKVNISSGRGVGMSAIKSELDVLGGVVTIENTKGQGVIFKFSIPLSQNDADSENILNAVIKQIKIFIQDNADVTIKDERFISNLHVDTFSAVIELHGGYEGKFILTFDNEVMEMISSFFIPKGFSQEEVDEMMLELSNEVANIALGLAISEFPSHLGVVEISPPLHLSDDEIYESIQESSSLISKEIQTAHGTIACALTRF